MEIRNRIGLSFNAELEQGSVTISALCVVTGKEYSVTCKLSEYSDWQTGMIIQNALPDMPREQREFLQSQMSPEGFNQIFPKE